MHFNELIIRYRSFSITAFVTLAGGLAALYAKAGLGAQVVFVVASLLLAFWLTCFLVDYFYYFRLLIGSVEHAAKWDDSAEARKLGFFGLTRSISGVILPAWAHVLVLTFYWLPLALAIVAILLGRRIE